MMMLSGLRNVVLSGVKCELIKKRKPLSLSGIHSTSFHYIPATSEIGNQHSTISYQLSDKSPSTMKLPVIYNNELFYNRPNLGKCPGSTACHRFTPVRQYSGIAKRSSSHNFYESSLSTYENDQGNIKRSLLRDRTAAIFRNYKRTFLRPSFDARQLGSVSLLDIKKFLRQKMVDFKESHACLCLR